MGSNRLERLSAGLLHRNKLSKFHSLSYSQPTTKEWVELTAWTRIYQDTAKASAQRSGGGLCLLIYPTLPCRMPGYCIVNRRQISRSQWIYCSSGERSAKYIWRGTVLEQSWAALWVITCVWIVVSWSIFVLMVV